ncbi:hypothetical protein Fmac_017014 [Flemingia macrophylla]|uniref:Bidirectional sugar transporter SWEET n=1 Tax=Flemingia macrophylla TaxID=520843 RepID=A0ABD1M1K3_9FABA
MVERRRKALILCSTKHIIKSTVPTPTFHRDDQSSPTFRLPVGILRFFGLPKPSLDHSALIALSIRLLKTFSISSVAVVLDPLTTTNIHLHSPSSSPLMLHFPSCDFPLSGTSVFDDQVAYVSPLLAFNLARRMLKIHSFPRPRCPRFLFQTSRQKGALRSRCGGECFGKVTPREGEMKVKIGGGDGKLKVNRRAWLSVTITLAFTVGMLGNVISLLVFLASMPTFCRIYKKKSTESFQSLPYLVALFSSMLWLYHALLKKNALLLVTINSFGCVAETIYIVFYITYATRDARRRTLKKISGGIKKEFRLISSSIQRRTLKKISGGIKKEFRLISSSIQVRGSENLTLGIGDDLLEEEHQEKGREHSDTDVIPGIHLRFISVFAAPLSIVLPNVLGFVLGLLQMMLYIIYRKGNKKGNTKEKSPVEPLKNIVVTGEVFPVEEDKQAEKSQEDKTSQDCVV